MGAEEMVETLLDEKIWGLVKATSLKTSTLLNTTGNENF